jgi:glycosyltransferase involved in cell wall biosynthesis
MNSINPKISVLMPALNAERCIGRALKSLQNQTFKDFELVVIDNGSTDKTREIAAKYADRVLLMKKRGIGCVRNEGIREAKADIIAFTDSDCEATMDWVEQIDRFFRQTPEEDVMAGETKIPKSTVVGDCISSLGFPGGGHVGFAKMWKVSKEGYTKKFTGCNFSFRKSVLKKTGLFDETLVAANDDVEMSMRMIKRGVKIRFNPKATIYHEARTSLISFTKWMYNRGRSNYHFKKRIGKVGSFILLRAWSSWNIIKTYFNDPKILLIVPLLLYSFFLQQFGYMVEKMNDAN